ncbi:hypothetical protein ACW4TU_42120 [Streptomyces sp. QTS52]
MYIFFGVHTSNDIKMIAGMDPIRRCFLHRRHFAAHGGTVRLLRKWPSLRSAGVLLILATVTCSCGQTLSAKGDRESERSARSLTTAERETLDRAELYLTGACMKAHGFWYDTAVSSRTDRETAKDEDQARRRFPYGIDDVDWALEYGFGDTDHGESPPSRYNRNLRYFQSLSASRQRLYQSALGGSGTHTVAVRLTNGYTLKTNTDGCMSEAQGKLYGDFFAWYRSDTIVGNLNSERDPKVFRDPAYKKKLSLWSRCMSEKGHRVESPQQLREQYVNDSKKLGATLKKSTQRKLAVTEAICVRSSRLARTGQQLADDYGAKERAFRKPEIEMQRRLSVDALARAQSLLTDGG